MRKFIIYASLSVLLMSAALIFTSCTGSKETDNENPEVTVVPELYEAAADNSEEEPVMPHETQNTLPVKYEYDGTYEHSNMSADIIVRRIKDFPLMPQNYKLLDWKELALNYDALVFDEKAGGKYMPLFWWNTAGYLGVPASFGLPSYIGGSNYKKDGAAEAVNIFSVLLGSTLMGVDKSNQNGNNYLDTTRIYYNKSLGTFFNNPGSYGGQSFWYEIFPSVLHTMLSSLYPNEPGMGDREMTSAEAWFKACESLGGEKLNFDATSYNHISKKTVSNGIWKEPDAAAGVAYIEYMAYVRFGDEKYLHAARWCMDWLEGLDYNPLYEVLAAYAPLVAARMNAEEGTNYTVGKFMDWITATSSKPRQGWGLISGNWGGYDVYGLSGSVSSDYAFCMNTFVTAAAVAPVARYDAQYAKSIAVWLNNAASNARLFYNGQLPEGHGTGPVIDADSKNTVPYEGLKKSYKAKSPSQTGDPIAFGWGQTDRGLYSGSPVGLFASIVEPTNIEGIVQFDLLATDFNKKEAYPTYMYLNPYKDTKEVEIKLPNGLYDLYDAVSRTFIKKSVSGSTMFLLQSEQTIVMLLVPEGGELISKNGVDTINGVFVGTHRPCVEIINPKPYSSVVNSLTPDINVLVPEGDYLTSIEVFLEGNMLYQGVSADIPKLDVSAAENGLQYLTVKIHTKNGLIASDGFMVSLENNLVDVLISTPPRFASEWEPMQDTPAAIGIKDGTAVLTAESGDWAGAVSPWFELDFDKNPSLTIEIDKAEPSYAVQLIAEGEQYGKYIIGDTNETGKITKNLKQQFESYHPEYKPEGKINCRIAVIPAGGKNAQVSIKFLNVFY